MSPSGSSPASPRRSRATPIATSACASGCATALAVPTGPQGSHQLTSMLRADGFAIVTAGEGSALPGDQVVVELA